MNMTLKRFMRLLGLILISAQVAQASDDTCSADGTCTADDSCVDKDSKCQAFAAHGECESNPEWMLNNCPASCKHCPEDYRLDGSVQQLLHGTSAFQATPSKVVELLRSTKEYMENLDIKEELKEICKNEHEMCAAWALKGECTANPTYMKRNCAPVCKSCDYLSIETRCPIDPNAPRAWEEGDLDRMFEKLTQEPYLSKYNVEILSSPATNGPWVITMENVVSAEEADRLIELGAGEGYERSSDVGKMKVDGTTERKVSTGRTSTNAWCQHECYEDPQAQSVAQRLSNLTGIDEVNSEFLQLLKYEPGQYYKVHHDYIEFHTERQQGVRILTAFLYLNDVEAGGGTNFDKLDITVMPKRGRALLWPSVKSSDPNAKDHRTTHQALPVEEGVKYGANAWFHMHDFKTPNREGCQ